eukprot:364050-Chlamydomonas_euryale.AAC.2
MTGSGGRDSGDDRRRSRPVPLLCRPIGMQESPTHRTAAHCRRRHADSTAAAADGAECLHADRLDRARAWYQTPFDSTASEEQGRARGEENCGELRRPKGRLLGRRGAWRCGGRAAAAASATPARGADQNKACVIGRVSVPQGSRKEVTSLNSRPHACEGIFLSSQGGQLPYAPCMVCAHRIDIGVESFACSYSWRVVKQNDSFAVLVPCAPREREATLRHPTPHSLSKDVSFCLLVAAAACCAALLLSLTSSLYA